MTQILAISALRRDGGTQPRAGLDTAYVEKLVDDLNAGVIFPAVDVFHDGTDNWLADGFHRVESYVRTGREDIECHIHQGSLADAQWFSFGANKANGLYRSNADKQRAVQAALRHPKSAGLSDAAIGQHVGVSDRCVSAWREKTTPKVSESTTTPVLRQCADGRTINVANIGKRATAQKSAALPRPGTGRRAMLANDQKSRMVTAISALGLIAEEAPGLNVELLRETCTDAELTWWAASIEQSASTLKKFARALREIPHRTEEETAVLEA